MAEEPKDTNNLTALFGQLRSHFTSAAAQDPAKSAAYLKLAAKADSVLQDPQNTQLATQVNSSFMTIAAQGVTTPKADVFRPVLDTTTKITREITKQKPGPSV